MPAPTFQVHVAGPRAFLALGDSYTIGEAVKEEERWPMQLVQALKKQNIDLDQPYILAETGWTTSDLQEALETARLAGPYRLVSLLIGVNDQYRRGTPEEFRPRLAALLKQAVGLAGGKAEHVLLLSIPDYDYGPLRKFTGPKIGESIDQFNVVCQEEAARAGVVYVGITATSREAKGKREYWASDQLHFSGAMYGKWVGVMLPAVVKMVK